MHYDQKEWLIFSIFLFKNEVTIFSIYITNEKKFRL